MVYSLEMKSTLHVFAQITPQSQYYDDARDAILGILPQTRKETGCHRFDVFDGKGDGCIYLFEEWEDQAALDAHYAKPYIAAVFKSYETWLTSDPIIYKLSKAA